MKRCLHARILRLERRVPLHDRLQVSAAVGRGPGTIGCQIEERTSENVDGKKCRDETEQDTYRCSLHGSSLLAFPNPVSGLRSIGLFITSFPKEAECQVFRVRSGSGSGEGADCDTDLPSPRATLKANLQEKRRSGSGGCRRGRGAGAENEACVNPLEDANILS